MQCSIWQKLNLNLSQILICIGSLEKVWEVEFLIFLRDTEKPAISIWNLMTKSLAANKIEIKWEILSNYQLKIADFYNFPNDKVKKSVPNFFDKEKYVLLHYENLQLYLK